MKNKPAIPISIKSFPEEKIKPNIFKDNVGLTLENELRFILSQYTEYKDAPYLKEFVYDSPRNGIKYLVRITISEKI